MIMHQPPCYAKRLQSWTRRPTSSSSSSSFFFFFFYASSFLPPCPLPRRGRLPCIGRRVDLRHPPPSSSEDAIFARNRFLRLASSEDAIFARNRFLRLAPSLLLLAIPAPPRALPWPDVPTRRSQDLKKRRETGSGNGRGCSRGRDPIVSESSPVAASRSAFRLDVIES